MKPNPSAKPCVGIPYRVRKEELNNDRSRYEKYVQAVRRAGGEPVEISLALAPDELKKLARSLDAIVLPGSPADIEPSLFHCTRHSKTADADQLREKTDFVLLEHAFAEGKPVLAICYGVQSMNVFLGGTLVQDIPSELQTKIQHSWPAHEGPEPQHAAAFEPGSRLAQLAGAAEWRVNSSHHQSVLEPGRNLRIVARAPDNVIEGVEWTGNANRVTGVQWHPERMDETDSFAQALFRDLVLAARKMPVHT